MCDVSFSVEAVVRECHKYKEIWVVVVGEELSCRREPTNWEDQLAVAVVKDFNVVGHISRKIIEDLVIAYFAVSKLQLLA